MILYQARNGLLCLHTNVGTCPLQLSGVDYSCMMAISECERAAGVRTGRQSRGSGVEKRCRDRVCYLKVFERPVKYMYVLDREGLDEGRSW